MDFTTPSALGVVRCLTAQRHLFCRFHYVSKKKTSARPRAQMSSRSNYPLNYPLKATEREQSWAPHPSSTRQQKEGEAEEPSEVRQENLYDAKLHANHEYLHFILCFLNNNLSISVLQLSCDARYRSVKHIFMINVIFIIMLQPQWSFFLFLLQFVLLHVMLKCWSKSILTKTFFYRGADELPGSRREPIKRIRQ